MLTVINSGFKPLQLLKRIFPILIIGAVPGWSQERNLVGSNTKWRVLPGVSLSYPHVISVPVSIVGLNGNNSMTPIFQLEPGIGGNKVKFGFGGNPGFKDWSGVFGKISLLNTWPILGQKMATYWGGEIQLSLLYLHFDLGYYTKTPLNNQNAENLVSAAIGFGL